MQHQTFKPTLLAALLASGVGSYLYFDLPAGAALPQAGAGQAEVKSEFDASFYGAAKAAEPQQQVRFVPAAVRADIELASLPLADTSLKHAAFFTAMRLDEPAQAPQHFKPRLSQTDAGGNQDVDPGLQEPVKAELAAVASQTLSTGPAVPTVLAVVQVPAPPEPASSDTAIQASLARSGAGQSLQSNPVALAGAIAEPAVLREEPAAKAGTGPALAASSQPLPDAPIEPAATAILPEISSPMLANAEIAPKTETGLANAGPAQSLAVSPAPVSAQLAVPAAPPQVPARTEPVATLAPAGREALPAAADPAAKTAGLMEVQQQVGPAPLALMPIKFKLDPTAKDAAAAKGLASARRPDRAGLAAKPRSNGSVLQKQSRQPDRVVGNFIFHQVSLRLNESPAGKIDVRIGGDTSLSIRVGALLSVVEGRLDPDLFAALNGSAGADTYVSFSELRAAGIDVRYEPASDTIVLTAD